VPRASQTQARAPKHWPSARWKTPRVAHRRRQSTCPTDRARARGAGAGDSALEALTVPTCHREGLVYNVAAMPAEPSPEFVSPESVPPGAASALAAASPAAAQAAVPRTERELNSPTPLTLQLLGVIFLATFLPWVAAKVACNVREAPVREPPELPADVLARQPKDAALELQQRAATGHYREAAELAKGDAAKELLEADARCQAEPQPCAALRAQAKQVATRAVLVGRGPLLAEARAESEVGGKTERYLMRLEADGNRWYVTTRAPYPGDLNTPIPVINVTPGPPTSIAAPPPAAGGSAGK